jgi:hypothetical protein
MVVHMSRWLARGHEGSFHKVIKSVSPDGSHTILSQHPQRLSPHLPCYHAPQQEMLQRFRFLVTQMASHWAREATALQYVGRRTHVPWNQPQKEFATVGASISPDLIIDQCSHCPGKEIIIPWLGWVHIVTCPSPHENVLSLRLELDVGKQVPKKEEIC